MSEFTSFTGQLLVSLPAIQAEYFCHTVTLVIKHYRHSDFGLVINKMLDVNLIEILDNQIAGSPPNITVLASGPIGQNRLFFLHTKEPMFEGSISINDELVLTTSLDILDAISEQRGPDRVLVRLGYAGWSGGQLEEEIQADAWLAIPYISNIVFDIPFDKRPEAGANSIGVDLDLISSTSGHG